MNDLELSFTFLDKGYFADARLNEIEFEIIRENLKD